MTDPFGLQRFVDAHEGVYQRVLSELRRGRKQSHWIWFIFPQRSGLGYSAMSQKFGIASDEEAAAYLAHPILGPRLVECTELVLAAEGSSASEIFGGIDTLKFHSSMTLFAAVSPADSVFAEALKKYFSESSSR